MDPGKNVSLRDAPILRINGSLLANYLNRRVVLIGTVTQFHQYRAIIETTDDKSVELDLKGVDLKVPITNGKLIEVLGSVKSPAKLDTERVVVFTDDQKEKFIPAKYNEFVKVFVAFADRFNFTQRQTCDHDMVERMNMDACNDFHIDWNLADANAAPASAHPSAPANAPARASFRGGANDSYYGGADDWND